ncbi:MAG: ABC transporter permease [Planctomycetota bacterium]
MYRLFLAVRYLLTRPINLLGIGGITISVWALVVVVSLFSGFLQVVEQHVRAASSDLIVSQLPPWAEWPELEAALRDDPNVAGAAPRVLHYGLLQPPGKRPPPAPLPGRSALHGGDQPFLFVFGIDPAAEREATDFDSWLRDPRIPDALRCAKPDDPLRPRGAVPTVLLGLERMQREGIQVGDTLRLTTAQLVSGEGGGKRAQKLELDLVVAGAFHTEHSGFEGNSAFLAIDVLRAELFPNEPGRIQEVAVAVHDPSQLDATADRLGRAVKRTVVRESMGYGLVQTWRQKNRQFLDSVAHQRSLMKIVLIVIMVVAAFLMLATLSMMVTEKTSDIGILTAMGGTPGGVTLVFLSCGLVITAVGVVVGLVLGVLTSVYLEEIRQALLWAFGVDLFPLDVYNLNRVPSKIEPLWLLQVTGMALGTGLLVSAIPALRAARHDPLVSLRGA